MTLECLLTSLVIIDLLYMAWATCRERGLLRLEGRGEHLADQGVR